LWSKNQPQQSTENKTKNQPEQAKKSQEQQWRYTPEQNFKRLLLIAE
jgi:hypothetical protein